MPQPGGIEPDPRLQSDPLIDVQPGQERLRAAVKDRTRTHLHGSPQRPAIVERAAPVVRPVPGEAGADAGRRRQGEADRRVRARLHRQRRRDPRGDARGQPVRDRAGRPVPQPGAQFHRSRRRLQHPEIETDQIGLVWAVLPRQPAQLARVVVVLPVGVQRVPVGIDLHRAYAARHVQDRGAAHRERAHPLSGGPAAPRHHADRGGQTAVPVVTDRDARHAPFVRHPLHAVVGVPRSPQHPFADASHSRTMALQEREEPLGIGMPVAVAAGVVGEGRVEGRLAHLRGELANGQGPLGVDDRGQTVLVALLVPVGDHGKVEARGAQRTEPFHQPTAHARVRQRGAGDASQRGGISRKQVVVGAVLPLQVVGRHVLRKRFAEPVVADEVDRRADAEVEVADFMRDQELQRPVPQLRERYVGVERSAAEHHQAVGRQTPQPRPHPFDDGDLPVVERAEPRGVVIEDLDRVAGQLARLPFAAGAMEHAHAVAGRRGRQHLPAIFRGDDERNRHGGAAALEHVGGAVRRRRALLGARDYPVAARHHDAHSIALHGRQRECRRVGVEPRIPAETLDEHAAAAGEIGRAPGRQVRAERDREPVAIALGKPQPHRQSGGGVGEQTLAHRRRELLILDLVAVRVGDAVDPGVARLEPVLVLPVFHHRVVVRVGDRADIVGQRQHRARLRLRTGEGDDLRAGDDRRLGVVGQVEAVALGAERGRLRRAGGEDKARGRRAEPGLRAAWHRAGREGIDRAGVSASAPGSALRGLTVRP